MHKLLCPSIMNLATDDLKSQIQRLDDAGVDIFHLDVMDGNFVPNFGMSLQEIALVRRMTDRLLDVHLMVENPIRYVQLFSDAGCDIIYIHYESNYCPSATLATIKGMGRKAGLVINPGTSIETVRPLFPILDYLMIMTVNPGFCGQPYMDYVEAKIDEALAAREGFSFPIVIDGGVDEAVLTRLYRKGVEGFVLGRLILFDQEEQDYGKIITQIRELV